MKNIFLLIVVCVVSASAFAQVQRTVVPVDKSKFLSDSTQKNKQGFGNKKKKQLFKELGLSKEQAGKLKEIRQSNKAKRQAINDNDSLSGQEKRMQLKVINKNADDAIKAILTEEQWKKYQEEKKKKLEEATMNMEEDNQGS